jgi:hypothetical protein
MGRLPTDTAARETCGGIQMTKDEELAMDLALEALGRMNHADSIFAGEFDKAITAIKQARSAPPNMPYGWVRMNAGFNSGVFHLGTECPPGWVGGAVPVSKIAPPAAQRQWVGLTEQERNDCLVEADPCECLATPEAQELMCVVEGKLKEKNT